MLDMPKLVLSAPYKPDWVLTLLSLFTSTERANEIEGDLLEESCSRSRLWFCVQVGLITLALFRQSFAKAPIATFLLSVASLLVAGVLTSFLLFPFVFQFVDYSVFTMMLLICVSRALACFLIGVALIEYAPELGSRAVCCTSLLMLSILLMRVMMHYQQWGVFADVFLGVVQSGVIYTIFSVLPIILGGVYSHQNRLKDRSKLVLEVA